MRCSSHLVLVLLVVVVSARAHGGREPARQLAACPIQRLATTLRQKSEHDGKCLESDADLEQVCLRDGAVEVEHQKRFRARHVPHEAEGEGGERVRCGERVKVARG